jgi:hypothetical protein
MTKLKTRPKVISITAKCSDLFYARFMNADGIGVAEYRGYVPDFFPEEHYGDYVQLDIDLATGQITNWKAPSLKAINHALKDGGE